MEQLHQQKQAKARQLIELAKQGVDVSTADPRETSMEAVITANRIRRAGGKVIEITL